MSEYSGNRGRGRWIFFFKKKINMAIDDLLHSDMDMDIDDLLHSGMVFFTN
jgi:hypothetical protein